MTAQYFSIKDIAWNNVLSGNTYIPFLHEKSLKGENSIFLEKVFRYRKVSSIYEKSVTHFIGWLTDPFTKKNDGGGVVGVVGVNQHFGETTFSFIIVIFVVYPRTCDCICDQRKSKGNFRWRERKLFGYDKLLMCHFGH